MDPFIEAEKVAGHSVDKACDLLKVSKSAYYERRNGVPSARQISDAELTEQIKAIHAESKGTYGAPRIHKELLHRHVACGKRRVTRLMRQAGLEGRCKKRWRKTTDARPGGRAGPRPHPAPLRTVRGDRPALRRRHHLHRHLGGLVLPGDRHRPGHPPGGGLGIWPITCAPSWSKTPSRWPSPHRAPEEGVIFHSDRGCQYTSRDFAELARANGVVLSVGRKGECWDNAVAESFFATIKRELIDTPAPGRREQGLRRAVFEYIEGWYNTRRLHSTLGYLSPAQYEAIHHNADSSGGIINPSNPSVKADQAHGGRGRPSSRHAPPRRHRGGAMDEAFAANRR